MEGKREEGERKREGREGTGREREMKRGGKEEIGG